jgi:hypothetical protein
MISNASGARSSREPQAGPARQRGITLAGMIGLSFLFIMLALLAFKVVPVYVEYYMIQKQLRGMADDPALKGARRADINRAWAARATVDNMTSLRAEDIAIDRQGDRLVLSADYSVKVQLLGNVSLCMDFHPTTAP